MDHPQSKLIESYRLIKQDLTECPLSCHHIFPHFSYMFYQFFISFIQQEASKSEALEFFQSCLSSENFQASLVALSEIGHYLDAWKSPRIKPLLTRQRELIDILAAASETQEAQAQVEETARAQGELNEAGSWIRTG